MTSEPEFAPDLYRGTAELYDRFRLPYSPRLINQLLADVRPSGDGRALDLGSGTGQLAFALGTAFAEVWAADPEPDMIGVIRSKITAGGEHNIRPVLTTAQDLDAPSAWFELVVVGNAFHRMPRQRVAERIADWLVPGGRLALCWSSAPWSGSQPWQAAFSELLADWRRRLDTDSRIPANLEESRAARPDDEVVRAAGLVPVGSQEVVEPYDWTPKALAGFSFATSFLPITVFGGRTAEFEADLSDRLQPYLHNGVVTDQVSYAYDLFSRPAPADT